MRRREHLGDDAHRIGENRYINGGHRRSENADLAAGCGRVLVLSPFGGRSRMPPEWGMDLATQVDELRGGGSRVETVFLMAARVTCLTPTRWIHERVRRPREEATTKAEHSRCRSPKAGADASETSPLGRRVSTRSSVKAAHNESCRVTSHRSS
jgi:hypothetical protein